MKAMSRAVLLAGCAFASLNAWGSCTSPVGVWRYVRETNHRVDGSLVQVDEPSQGYSGTLIYTAAGYMSAILMPRGSGWKQVPSTPDELRSRVLAPATTAYTGRYTIDAAASTITHHIETALDPSDEGRELTRGCMVREGYLELSGSWEYRGEVLTFRVLWEKVAGTAGPDR